MRCASVTSPGRGLLGAASSCSAILTSYEPLARTSTVAGVLAFIAVLTLRRRLPITLMEAQLPLDRFEPLWRAGRGMDAHLLSGHHRLYGLIECLRAFCL